MTMGGSPGSPRLLQATLAGAGCQVFADEDHAHVRVEHKENGSRTLVRSGQSVKEAMCVIVDVQIEIVDRGIDAAVAYAATGMVPERLMRWHVEE